MKFLNYIWEKMKSGYAKIRQGAYSRTLMEVSGVSAQDLLKQMVRKGQLEAMASFMEDNASYHEEYLVLDASLVPTETWNALGTLQKKAYIRRYCLARAQVFRELTLVTPPEGLPLGSITAYSNTRLPRIWETIPDPQTGSTNGSAA